MRLWPISRTIGPVTSWGKQVDVWRKVTQSPRFFDIASINVNGVGPQIRTLVK